MEAKDTFLNRKITLNSKGRLIDLSEPQVMAILNLTPDSFYSNSRIASTDLALAKVETFMAAGATFIDLGAYSSRSGAADVSETDELKRLIPVVEAISKTFPQALLSIDTFRAKVAEAAIEAGAHLINDISGGNLDPAMFETVARLQVPYILMHMKGTPQNMQQAPSYQDILSEVLGYFAEKITSLRKLGVKDLLIDPGFGFAKSMAHNYELLHKMEGLKQFELPVMVGFSRKSMITKLLKIETEAALNGTSVLNTIALLKGANILRVHDVKEAVECITLVNQLGA